MCEGFSTEARGRFQQAGDSSKIKTMPTRQLLFKNERAPMNRNKLRNQWGKDCAIKDVFNNI